MCRSSRGRRNAGRQALSLVCSPWQAPNLPFVNLSARVDHPNYSLYLYWRWCPYLHRKPFFCSLSDTLHTYIHTYVRTYAPIGLCGSSAAPPLIYERKSSVRFVAAAGVCFLSSFPAATAVGGVLRTNAAGVVTVVTIRSSWFFCMASVGRPRASAADVPVPEGHAHAVPRAAGGALLPQLHVSLRGVHPPGVVLCRPVLLHHQTVSTFLCKLCMYR